MTSKKHTAFTATKPYFDLVRSALGNLVDGEHFFDSVSEDIAYEVLYDFPGWPRVIQGRSDLMASFREYGKHIVLHAADHLTKHLADNRETLVIEYEVHGTILSTGVEYNNRFCSIIKIANRRIVHWRDYMDSLSAWNALSVDAQP